MKGTLLIALLVSAFFVKAQKIENIYVNLYTDSLKKGTFNYINIDGLLSNGKYLPLDSTHLIFWASAGKFSGNSLWIDRDFAPEKVNIRVTLRKDARLTKEFEVYIKKLPDPVLRTMEQMTGEMQPPSKSKKKKGKK